MSYSPSFTRIPSSSSASIPTQQPVIPPKSSLRIQTDVGRMRSNSHAVTRTDASSLSPGSGSAGSGPGTGISTARPPEGLSFGGAGHQPFSRSMSYDLHSPHAHAQFQGSTRSPTSALAPREARDVFAAVRGLRGESVSRPVSPPLLTAASGSTQQLSFVPEGYMENDDKEVVSFASTSRHGESELSNGIGREDVFDSSQREEGPVLDKINQALKKSGDGGDTLDLSRKGIYTIGPLAVDAFRRGVGKDGKGVWRLALSYNRLDDFSIDPTFSLLSRLRYLNLKGNNFAQFPSALSDMPALEILDLSKNRIASFPLEPGRLIHLKVLSLTNNKLYTLPDYLVQFESLKVFKVDHNPIEWPPREVLGALIDHESPREPTASGKDKQREEDLRPWIQNMKSWMRQRSAEADRLLQRSGDKDSETSADDHGTNGLGGAESIVQVDSASSLKSENGKSPITPSSALQTVRPVREETAVSSPPMIAVPSPTSTVHTSRPALGQRSRSATLSSETQRKSPVRPPPLKLVMSHSRTHSTTSTPPDSAVTTSSSAHSRNPSAYLSAALPPPVPETAPTPTHSRGASYTATQRMSGPLSAKKSLPDLRQSHAKIMQDRRESGIQKPDEYRPLGLGIAAPQSARYSGSTPAWTADLKPFHSAAFNGPTRSAGLPRIASADLLQRLKGKASDLSPINERRNSQESPTADESRNSYFRRLSTLPASSVSNTIPPALLRFVDGIRGILFALSQLHASVRQYLIFAVKDRVAGLFSRVMDPASGQLATLINALDRFDSTSRRGVPPPSAIKGVLDAAKESIAVFAKVVAMLRLQLPAFKGCDVRYTRQLLLMIYGSMAEVSYAWTAMAPLVLDLKSGARNEAALPRGAFGGHRMLATGSFPGRTPISPIPERGESHSPPSVTRTERPDRLPGSSPLQMTINNGSDGSHTPTPTSGVRSGFGNRRQAGSFSMQDVERGMLMSRTSPAKFEVSPSRIRHRPSDSVQSSLVSTEISEADEQSNAIADDDDLYDLPPNPPFAHRANRSNGSSIHLPQTPPDVSHALQPVAMVPTTSQGSSHHDRRHKQTSSAGSSHLMHGYSRKMSVDIQPPTPASAVDFDNDLLDVIEAATDVAFTAWLRLAEDVGGVTDSASLNGTHHRSESMDSEASMTTRPAGISAKHHSEMLDLLSVSEQITTSLRESLMGIRADSSSTPSSHARATLREQSESFVKTVVKVTELVMKLSSTHTFSPPTRQSCSKLVQFTREFAILFSVSAVRPGTSASVSHSHAAQGQGHGHLHGHGHGHGQTQSHSHPYGNGLAARSASPVYPIGSIPRGSSASLQAARAGHGNGYGYGYGYGYEARGQSSDDLLQPVRFTSGDGESAANVSAIASAPKSAGLRGLRLPSRQAARARLAENAQ